MANADLEKEQDSFYRQLGELVTWFAAAENSLTFVAIFLLGGPMVGSPVLANLHLNRVIELVRELLRGLHGNSEHFAAFDATLLAFKRHAKERNDLLHGMSGLGLDPTTGAVSVSIINARRGRAWHARTHVAELTERVRDTNAQILWFGTMMKIFDADLIAQVKELLETFAKETP